MTSGAPFTQPWPMPAQRLAQGFAQRMGQRRGELRAARSPRRPPTAIAPARAGRGFTLVEMLVVTAILGVLATAVTLGVNSVERSHLGEEARRLQALLEIAGERSRWSGAAILWRRDKNGYRFDRQAATATAAAAQQAAAAAGGLGDEVLRPRTLPPPLRVRAVEVEGRILGEDEPVVFVAGVAPMFRIVLGDGVATRTLAARADGLVELEAAQ